MESDKQIYLIFQSQPQWVFLLLHEPPPVGVRFESVALKSIEKRVDGAWIPASREDPEHPMVAVFAPLFERSEEVLESVAAKCYNRLDNAELDQKSVAALQEVFVS